MQDCHLSRFYTKFWNVATKLGMENDNILTMKLPTLGPVLSGSKFRWSGHVARMKAPRVVLQTRGCISLSLSQHLGYIPDPLAEQYF
jgi:hypothetical protein